MKKHKRVKRLLPHQLYHFIDVVVAYRTPVWDELINRFEVCRLEDAKRLLDAKRLHAGVYLGRDFIKSDDLQGGIIRTETDPYQEHADYFGVIDRDDQSVIAVARQIRHIEERSLPIFEHVKLQKDYSYIEKSQIVEISAFAKQRGADSRSLLLLFRGMLTYSISKKHSHWLMLVDKKVYMRLKTLFGPVIRRIGPESFYMGSVVIPAEVDLETAERLLERGYRFSLPPLRGVRRLLHSSFATSDNRSRSRPAFWNAYAKAYDGLLTFAPYRHLVEHVCDIVLSYKPRKVLDLGCGTGNVTALLVAKDPKLHVDAVDWSQAMLDMLPKKVTGRNVVISRRDALSFLESSQERYDVIVMNNVLYTISDRKRLWKLLKGRIHRRGRIVVANPDTADSRSLIKNHVSEKSFVSLLRPSLMAVWIFDSLISLNSSSNTFDFTSQTQLLAELDAAGLCVDGKVSRCYGGHTNGIDLLLSVKNKAEAV